MKHSPPDTVRTSDERWGKLFVLLRSFERAVEASSRLDAYVPRIDAHGHPVRRIPQSRHNTFTAFNARLVMIEQRIDLEFDRLTSDRLRVDLSRKLLAGAA